MPGPEELDQESLVNWARGLEGAWPELDMLLAVPNGGKRSQRTGAMLKRAGTKRGAPDLLLLVARRGYHGLAIELKSPRPGKNSSPIALASPEQKKMARRLGEEGFLSKICFIQEAKDVIRWYLDSQIERPKSGFSKA